MVSQSHYETVIPRMTPIGISSSIGRDNITKLLLSYGAYVKRTHIDYGEHHIVRLYTSMYCWEWSNCQKVQTNFKKSKIFAFI